jgi:putative methyltransferase (TIGR04325 family)
MQRATLKGLVPPIAHVLLRSGRRYSTWEGACAAASSYDYEALNAFKVARSAQRRVDGSLLTASVLQLAALALRKPDVAVTDFGGATGDLGRDFLAAWPGASYTVVETPALVAMMQGHSAVRFEPSIPKTCDLFFSSGTLQYVDKPMEVMAEGFTSALHAVVLVRNTFCDELSITCSARNCSRTDTVRYLRDSGTPPCVIHTRRSMRSPCTLWQIGTAFVVWRGSMRPSTCSTRAKSTANNWFS